MKSLITVLSFTILLSFSNKSMSGDVVECVHIDVPTGQFQVLGPIYHMERCSKYYYLLSDDVHGQKNKIHNLGNGRLVDILINSTKVHDPDVCVIREQIRGNLP